jgi:hypothetical protein
LINIAQVLPEPARHRKRFLTPFPSFFSVLFRPRTPGSASFTAAVMPFAEIAPRPSSSQGAATRVAGYSPLIGSLISNARPAW